MKQVQDKDNQDVPKRHLEDEIQYNQDGSTGDGYDSHVIVWFFEKHEPMFHDDLPF